MITEIVAVVKGNEYHIIPTTDPLYLVSSKSRAGVWHKTSAINCTCEGFEFNRTCSHQQALKVVSLKHDRDELSERIDNLITMLQSLDADIKTIEAGKTPMQEAEEVAIKAQRTKAAKDLL